MQSLFDKITQIFHVSKNLKSKYVIYRRVSIKYFVEITQFINLALKIVY